MFSRDFSQVSLAGLPDRDNIPGIGYCLVGTALNQQQVRQQSLRDTSSIIEAKYSRWR
jgi:hypothetical protein